MVNTQIPSKTSSSTIAPKHGEHKSKNMVNTRAKIKKPTQNIEDFNQQWTESGPFNDDLLTEIFLRLPATSIIRFKAACKHWLRLLTDTHFTLRYDTLFKTPGVFIHVPFDVKNPRPPPFDTLDFYSDPSGITIEQSCNGLLLCCSYNPSRTDARNYYVFNPTTKQYVIIPQPLLEGKGGPDVSKSIHFMGLAFHPIECVHYKVVCIRQLDPRLYQILIYSSDTRKWKVCKYFYPSFVSFGKGVYWNGAIYWGPYDVYLKVDAEQLHNLLLPMKGDDVTIYFGESRGHLHLVRTNCVGCENPLHINVYERLIDHSGWFVKYQVELDELPGAFPKMISSRFYQNYEFTVIDVVRGEKEEDTFMVLRIPWKIITYNVHDKSFKEISNGSSYSYYVPQIRVQRYIECLASF